MREVDEAAGEAVADSVAAHTDAQKTAQDYIPIILDDDVRQKGRAKQKQMMITRGKLSALSRVGLGSLAALLPAQTNVEKTAEAAASAPVCTSFSGLFFDSSLITLPVQSLSMWTAPSSARCASRPPGSSSESTSLLPLSLSADLSLPSDEAFRAITSNAPPAKRVYLTSIRQNIIKYKNRANSFASFWLFSLRGDRSVLLTMPES